MGLSIGVKHDSKVQVGAHVLEVESIVKEHAVIVWYGGKRFTVTEQERVEIAPTVFLSLGRNPSKPSPSHIVAPNARLLFEAPRAIQITRLDAGHPAF